MEDSALGMEIIIQFDQKQQPKQILVRCSEWVCVRINPKFFIDNKYLNREGQTSNAEIGHHLQFYVTCTDRLHTYLFNVKNLQSHPKTGLICMDYVCSAWRTSAFKALHILESSLNENMCTAYFVIYQWVICGEQGVWQHLPKIDLIVTCGPFY